ncbi:NADH-quinone oxidoreductase subunit C [Roseibacillus persicicus]|uniref:NADH-quinone oxidoreductase subunit C n=1 Tax=Roseibacillus persicicus TaxID=454148 RepID=UPI00280DC50C|nr:NADH-quinone oxidoreductase subunit C [Roseibacillus persicicus]MDQ8190838.1 NADH-quinone oxidoreductase subunit C [Roseibacillus persicicus]
MNSELISADVDSLREKLGKALLETVEFRNETTVVVESASLEAALKEAFALGYDFLIDISSIDHDQEEPRFEMVYELANVDDSKHLRVRSKVEEGGSVPTAVNIWKSANWHEREVYDMMGITFDGHPDMRRILMWEGYPYFPLRKEFPLAGKPTDMPDVAATRVAPMEGGPFVTSPGGDRVSSEPRAKGES